MQETNGGGQGVKSILGTIGLLLFAPLIAVFITTFVFQSYQVDGPSMQSTLQNEDRLIVVKLARTWSKLTHHAYIPKRGDIIIFKKAGSIEAGTNNEKQLIKRVMALPGERITVDEGKVTVFNKEHPEGFNPDSAAYGSVIGFTPGKVDIVVPKDEVFVCGDNRGNSYDSRYFGTIAASEIVGKLDLRILPINQAKSF